MRHLFVLGCVAVALVAGSAQAAISITYRSSVISYRQDAGNPPVTTFGADAANGVGTKSIFARGYSFTSTVTAAGISTGKMRGEHQIASPFFAPYELDVWMKIDVNMTVTEGGAKVDLLMNGSTLGGGFTSIPAADQNGYILIYDAVTNALLFDSATIGVVNGGAFPGLSWDNSKWSGTLPPGSYRIAIRTDGDLTELMGAGGGWHGASDINASLTFTALIPAPSTLALAAPLCLLNLRRRK